MDTNDVDLAKEGVSFLLTPQEEFEMGFGDINSSLEKLEDAVNVLLEIRSDIFMQREEKIQQYKQNQMLKLKAEEDDFINKFQELEAKILENKAQIREIEHACQELSGNLTKEMELNQKLEFDVSLLNEENEKAREQFNKTYSLFSSVIKLYQDHLKLNIVLNRENINIISVYIDNGTKAFNNEPLVKLERVNDSEFKLLELHSDMDEFKENIQQVFNTYELKLFLFQAYKRLKNASHN